MDDRIAEDARFALLAKVRQARMMSAEEMILAEAKTEASVVWKEDERENARQSKS